MKLRNRILLYHAASLVVLTSALISVGWFTIQEVTRNQYERELSQELNRIIDRARQVTTTLEKWGIDNQEFLTRKQQDFINQYNGYRYGETGGLNVIPPDTSVDFSKIQHLMLSSDVLPQLQKSGNGFIWLESLGHSHFAVYRSYEPWNWVFVLSVSREEMFAYRIRFLIIVVLVSISAMMIMLTSAAFLVGQLVKKFDVMLASVQRIEDGDFSPRIVDIDSSPEISKLQHGINSMAASLQERTIARDNAELALKNSEEKYRQLIETSNDVIYVMVNNKFELVNKKFTEVMGYTKEEVCDPDFNFMKMIAPSSMKIMEERRKRVILGQPVSRTYSMTALTRDGREIEFDVSVTYLDTDSGVAVQAILRDITQRSISEQQLRQKQKMEAIGTLAGGIAHDFNNILSVILGYADLLKMEMDYNTENRASLQEIVNAATKARDLVNQIISFTRRSDREFKPVSIHDLVRDAMNLIKSLIPENVRVSCELDTKYRVLADASNIHQIMLNLCMNAAFAMEKNGGQLDVSLRDIAYADIPLRLHEKIDAGDYVHLQIKDTGHGIPPEIINRIFDPYFSTKPKDKGSGLGLAIVQGIVSTLNGAIEVSSIVGEGTAFDIYLPVLQKDGAYAGRYVEEDVMATAPLSILYVDDESSIVVMIKKALSSFGYNVTGYTDSKEAMQEITESIDQLDLIISDLSMPDFTGLDIARKANSLRPDLPIIICTGFHERGNELKIGQYGIRSVITKPLSLRELVGKIEEVTVSHSKKS